MTAELNCNSIRSTLWDFAAGTLGESERLMVAMHLDECRECKLHCSEVRSLRTGLNGLPQMNVPSLLGTRLRVIASRERSRQALRRDLAARMAELRARARLVFDNLLRPIAVPAAGGMLASFLVFGVIVDTLHVYPVWDNDVPFGVYTEVVIDDVSPFPLDGHDLMVQLTVDKHGKVSDFEVPQGTTSPEQLRDIGNLVLFGSFVPATAFGQPVTGKILVTISHVNINIRG